VKPSVRDVLERDGVVERLGADGIYLSVSLAVDATSPHHDDTTPSRANPTTS
jgi:hypothetical protein